MLSQAAPTKYSIRPNNIWILSIIQTYRTAKIFPQLACIFKEVNSAKHPKWKWEDSIFMQ